MIKNLFKKYSENKIKKQKIRKQILDEIEKHESEIENARLESLNESFDLNELFKDAFGVSDSVVNLIDSSIEDMRIQKISNFVFRNGKLSLAYLKKFVEDKNKKDISINWPIARDTSSELIPDKYKFEIKKNKIYINDKIFKKPEDILNELKNMKKFYKKYEKITNKTISLEMAYMAKHDEIYPRVKIDTAEIEDSFVYPDKSNDMEDLEQWINSDESKKFFSNFSNHLKREFNFTEHMTNPSKKINKTFIKKLLNVHFVSIRTPRSSIEIEDGKVTIAGKKIKGDEKLIETLKDIKNDYIKNKKILDDEFEKIRKKMKLDIKS